MSAMSHTTLKRKGVPKEQTIVRLDGIPILITPPDIDRDGIVGGKEKVVQRFGTMNQGGTTPIIQPSELGESLKYLNDDTVDPETRMSDIDMKSRLHPLQTMPISAWEWLTSNRVLTRHAGTFTRIVKRNSVSIKGLGRSEMVQMTQNKKEMDVQSGQGGVMSRIKGLLGGGSS